MCFAGHFHHVHTYVRLCNTLSVCICRTLLELGASPNYRDARGLTPLYLSVIKKTDAKICESLLHDHATLSITDAQGWMEIHQVCTRWCDKGYFCHNHQARFKNQNLRKQFRGFHGTSKLFSYSASHSPFLLIGISLLLQPISNTKHQILLLAFNLSVIQFIFSYRKGNILFFTYF